MAILWLLFIAWQGLSIVGVINIIVCTILLCAISAAGYEGKKLISSIFSIFFSVLWVIIEVFVGFIVVDIRYNAILGAVLSKALLFAVVIIINNCFSESYNYSLPVSQILSLVVIPICSFIIALGLFSVINNKLRGTPSLVWASISAISLILINILVYRFYGSMSKEWENKKKI
ncbi:hypothetical protein [Ohessyouella blattaphilus]|uniref:hypothetical protein n=1 Tax=Ohessyouella blattaphilus TaxID=2949333 RepID=UPI003EB80614